jgi:predicted nucleic acid-binding protein
MRWVADTGPLLHLAEAGALELLPLLGEVVLPPAVLEELSRLSPATRLPSSLIVRSLHPASATQAEDWCKAGLVHRGEAQAIALCRQVAADFFLTDDAAARLLANTLGVQARGSLGVVLWLAGQRTILPVDAEHYLDRLANSSLWLAPRVLAEARVALKNLPWR